MTLALAAVLACCTVTAVPARPAPGTFAALTVVAGPAATAVRGSAAGEPLHFQPGPAGAWRAILPVPVDARDSLAVTIEIERAGAAPERLARAVPLSPRRFPAERLSVDPALARPDSVARARIAREQARALAVARASHETPALWTTAFRRPRSGRRTSGFGGARVFNGEVVSRHLGADFAGTVGAPVVAANRGVVALVDEFLLAGRLVYLDHGGGITTGYFHLSRVDVGVGDTVRAGQRIGAVGRTGRVTGPHLHWVARYGEVPLDPLSLPGLAGR